MLTVCASIGVTLFGEERLTVDELLKRADLAMYASTTPTDDGLILWYPERKFFLLGKRITRAWLGEIPVPDR